MHYSGSYEGILKSNSYILMGSRGGEIRESVRWKSVRVVEDIQLWKLNIERAAP